VTISSHSGGLAAETHLTLAPWRQTGIGLLRIAFGLVWAIDAWFKWQPAFINNFTNYLTGAKQDACTPPVAGGAKLVYDRSTPQRL